MQCRRLTIRFDVDTVNKDKGLANPLAPAKNPSLRKRIFPLCVVLNNGKIICLSRRKFK